MSFQLIAVGACAAGMALVGLVYNTPTVYFMVAALVAVLVVSYVSSRLSAGAVDWRREASDRVFENEPIAISAELTNRGRLPRFLLTVSDHLPEFLRSEQPAEFVLPALWPREKVKLSYQAYAVKRGVYTIGPLRVSVSDPFGVFQRFVSLPASGEAVIYPRPVPLTTLESPGAISDPAQSGGERSQASESGLEFYGIRDYQPGDELRRIHWPATAHHNQLTVIEFERGASRSLTVALDAMTGTEFGAGLDTTLEIGVKLSASLIHWALESHGYASFIFDSAAGPQWTEMDRLDQEYEALEQLARLKAEGSLPVSQLLDWAALRIQSGGSVCIVTAAPDRRLPGLVRLLADRRVRVAVALIDAISFDPKAPSQISASELEVAGAVTAIIRCGDRIQEVLTDAFVAPV